MRTKHFNLARRVVWVSLLGLGGCHLGNGRTGKLGSGSIVDGLENLPEGILKYCVVHEAVELGIEPGPIALDLRESLA
jgi:hypothetical protein